MRQILLAGEEPHEWPALLRDVIAHGPAQHRIVPLKSVENGALRSLTLDFKFQFALNRRQSPQMRREYDSNHGNVCTSTESTAGRFWAMAVQVSPASGDAYTCPPEVPKYTPQ